MNTKIIHNREVYINENGKVIFDVDGKVPLLRCLAYGGMYQDGSPRNTLENMKSWVE